jgi:hypothetical protein
MNKIQKKKGKRKKRKCFYLRRWVFVYKEEE